MGHWKEYLDSGFSKIDRDFAFLLDCACEVFEELGETELAAVVSSMRNGGSLLKDGRLPSRGAQAISIAFQLLNMVEENASNQTMRAREADLGLLAEPGLWGYCLKRVKDANISEDALLDKVATTRVEPVLTSHPTEAKRWTVLDQHRAIYLQLVELENQMYSPSERELIRDEIKAGLERLWRTGEILLQKPDVASERRNALYYFKVKFPDVLNLLDQRFLVCWEAAGFDPALPRKRRVFPHIRFGSWVGGDRDGHPLVTASVTRETLEDLRTDAVEVLQRELARLEEMLVLSAFVQDLPEALKLRMVELLREQGLDPELVETHEEPWRLFATLIRQRLPGGDRYPCYRFPSEMAEDLAILEQALVSVRADRIVQANLFPLQRMLEVFGFHLASLDVRQNSEFHDTAIGQLMEAAGIASADEFGNWPEEKRLEFLERELESPRPFLHPQGDSGPQAKAVLDCYRVLSRHISERGRSGLGCLIVSMTRSLSDLLAVYLLCREGGLTRQTSEGQVCLLPVVPLFETIDDLERSPSILKRFLEHPFTRRSLRYQDPALNEAIRKREIFRSPPPESSSPLAQVVMLGYSDSNKDSGILASLWALREAQLSLLEVGQELGVEVRFFHGRGGTISRGAGPTHRFLEALPGNSLDGGIRVTEQGETIAQKYTNKKTATSNLELLCAGAVSEALLSPLREAPEPICEIVRRLAEFSREEYQELLNGEGFLGFYREATPIDVLEASRIGSRPSRRTGRASLEDLRAIPWVFSWTQSRFYLPGWYGVGTALERFKAEYPGDFAEFSEAAGKIPFLRYLLINVETNQASADSMIMEKYASLVGDEALRSRFFTRINDEHERTGRMIGEIFGGMLRERRPRFYKTLRARDSGLRMLHEDQICLLRQWRGFSASNDTARAEALLPDLLLSVNAIASGLRTTG